MTMNLEERFEHEQERWARARIAWNIEYERLEQWIRDLQSGMYVNCVYCGHRYGPKDKVPVAMAEALKQHIAQCPKHPMSALIKSATGAAYLIASLLAVREGATDVLLRQNLDALNAALAAAGADEVRT